MAYRVKYWKCEKWNNKKACMMQAFLFELVAPHRLELWT